MCWPVMRIWCPLSSFSIPMISKHCSVIVMLGMTLSSVSPWLVTAALAMYPVAPPIVAASK